MLDTIFGVFDKESAEEFHKLYKANKHESSFTYKGAPVLTTFAKYLIEYFVINKLITPEGIDAISTDIHKLN